MVVSMQWPFKCRQTVQEYKSIADYKQSLQCWYCFLRSDGWKAYNKLADHLDLDDVLHYPVNHSENYVDPETGAHTQTIEGFWRQLKAWLPNFGLKPTDLPSYIGAFCWYRYCKQRKLDFFLHFLRCISNKRPFLNENLPNATMQEVGI